MIKSRVLTMINILGLAVGIACAILIIFYVKDEITFDSFHSKSDRIYRPYTEASFRGRENVNTATPFSLGPQLSESYDEVEAYTVWTGFNDLVEHEDKSFNEGVSIVSEGFFRMFDFPLLSGNLENMFQSPSDLVITRSIAEKYFGTFDAIGNNLLIQVGTEQKDFEIKAVLEDVPSNSSLNFEILIGDQHLKDVFPERMLTSWFMITGDTYVMLKEGTSPEDLSGKLDPMIEKNLGQRAESMEYVINFQPLTDMHLNSELPPGNTPVSDPKYIFILSAIAVFILIIASINFTLLALGRSLNRMKEIGVRKAIGAMKFQLRGQFIGEALLTSLISLALGLAMALLLIDTFNELSGKDLAFDLSLQNLGLFIALAIGLGLVAGFYPAIVLSRYNPVTAIKGETKNKTGLGLRSFLVAGQFVLSIFLISCTLIMQRQLYYLQNKNLGFDKENVLVLPLNVANSGGLRDGIKAGFEKANQILPSLTALPEVISVGVSSHTFEPGTWTQVGWMDESDVQHSFFYNTVDASFVPTLGIKVLDGRNFSEDNQADFTKSILVNQAFVERFELDNPIGASIPHNEFMDNEIVGVIDDFHIQSLHVAIEPLVLALNTEIGFSGASNVNVGSNTIPKLFVRIHPDEIQQGLREIEKVWNATYAGEPFDYVFIDENLREQYDREKNLGNIVSYASLIAILIGCMGLFGLSTLTLLARIKEVSIRKIFGASRKSLILTLSKGFALMILISMVLATPLGWLVMDSWLEEFEYKTQINPFIFITAGVITLIIAGISIGYQTIRTTMANPAVTLRSE